MIASVLMKNRTMMRQLIYVFIVCPCIALGATTNTGSLSLLDAYKVAKEHNTDLAAAKQAVLDAKASYEITQGDYSSDIDFSIAYNKRNNDVTTASISNPDSQDATQSYGEVKWTFPWWHKSGVELNIKQAGIAVEQAVNNYQLQLTALEKNVITSYYDVKLAEKKLQIAKDTLSVVNTRLASISESYKLGNMSRLNLIHAMSNSLDHTVNVKDLEQTLRDKRQALADLLNVDLENTVVLDQDMVFNPDLDAAVSVNKAENDAVKDLELQARKQGYEIDRATDKWKPKLSVKAVYTRNEYNSSLSGTNNGTGASYGVELAVPLPGFSQSDKKAEKARSEVRQLDEQVVQVKAATRKSISRLQEKIRNLNAQLQLLTKLVKEKKEEVTAARYNFSIGKITNLELQLVENNVDQARSRYFDTLYDQLTSVAQLCSLGDEKGFINKFAALKNEQQQQPEQDAK